MYHICWIFFFKVSCLILSMSTPNLTDLDFFNNTVVYIYFHLNSLHFPGSYHDSENQLTLYTEFYVFISRGRFPKSMTNCQIIGYRHHYKTSTKILRQVPISTFSNRNFPSNMGLGKIMGKGPIPL